LSVLNRFRSSFSMTRVPVQTTPVLSLPVNTHFPSVGPLLFVAAGGWPAPEPAFFGDQQK
jgi:hypothetical protein